MQISHNYTYTPSFQCLLLLSPSQPSRLSQSTRLGSLCYAATSYQLSILHTIECISCCHFLHSSHSLLPPLCSQVYSLHLNLHSFPANSFINIIFLDSIYICVCINILYLFFSSWLVSVCVTGFSFIHLTTTDSNLLFLWLSNIPFLIATTTSLHSSVDGHIGCFHVLAIVNSVAMNIGVHISFRIVVISGYMPSSGDDGSYGRFILSFFKESPYCSPKWLYQFTFPPTV